MVDASTATTDTMTIPSGYAFVKFNQDTVDTLSASNLYNWEQVQLTIVSFATALAVGASAVGLGSAALLY